MSVRKFGTLDPYMVESAKKCAKMWDETAHLHSTPHEHRDVIRTDDTDESHNGERLLPREPYLMSHLITHYMRRGHLTGNGTRYTVHTILVRTSMSRQYVRVAQTLRAGCTAQAAVAVAIAFERAATPSPH